MRYFKQVQAWAQDGESIDIWNEVEQVRWLAPNQVTFTHKASADPYRFLEVTVCAPSIVVEDVEVEEKE